MDERKIAYKNIEWGSGEGGGERYNYCIITFFLDRFGWERAKRKEKEIYNDNNNFSVVPFVNKNSFLPLIISE